MTDYADEIYGEGAGTLAAARDAGEPKMKAAVASALDAADSLKDAASAVIDQGRSRAKTLAEDAVHQAQDRYGDVEAWVHQNPTRALGVAAGIGVVLGFLLRGRSTRVVQVRGRR